MTIGFLAENRGESPAFQVPSEFNIGNGVATPKAYAGHNQRSNYYFYTIEEVNRKKSDEAGFEVKDVTEICEFKNDAKCSPAHRIDASLFEMHPEILADYQRWKQGKVSDVTEVRNWDALSVGEMGNLIATGFYSVEQVASSSDTELMVLGLGWKDVKMKADQHMKKKMRDRQGIQENLELSQMQKELAVRDEQLAELRAMVEALAPKQPKVTLEAVIADEEAVEAAEKDIAAKPKIVAKKPTAKGKRKVGLQE